MEPPPLTQEAMPQAPIPPSTSIWARLMNVFVTPSEVFDEVKFSAPSAANWVVPAVLLILVGWIGGWLIFSQEPIRHQLSEMADKNIQKTIEKNHIPKEQADKIREQGEKFGVMGPMIATAVLPVALGLGLPFFWGFILWLVGNKVHKANFPYMKAVEVTGLGNTIGILNGVVGTLLILVTGSLFTSPSLMLLVKDYNPNNNVHAFLALVNVMTIWILAVRSIGFSRLSGISFGKAAVWVFGIWAAYTGVFYGIGVATRAAFGG